MKLVICIVSVLATILLAASCFALPMLDARLYVVVSVGQEADLRVRALNEKQDGPVIPVRLIGVQSLDYPKATEMLQSMLPEGTICALEFDAIRIRGNSLLAYVWRLDAPFPTTDMTLINKIFFEQGIATGIVSADVDEFNQRYATIFK